MRKMLYINNNLKRQGPECGDFLQKSIVEFGVIIPRDKNSGG